MANNFFCLPAGVSKTKLLEQPIPASFLKLEERVRYLAVSCKHEDTPPVLKEQVFMYVCVCIRVSSLGGLRSWCNPWLLGGVVLGEKSESV